MTCVQKEYEVKIKTKKEQRLKLNRKFLLSYNMVGRKKIDMGGLLVGGENFSGGGGMSRVNFLLVGGKNPLPAPHPSRRGNSVIMSLICYISLNWILNHKYSVSSEKSWNILKSSQVYSTSICSLSIILECKLS